MSKPQKKRIVSNTETHQEGYKRAMVHNALSQLAQMENQLRVLRNTLEPLASKTVEVRTRSADGKIDYTKTSVLFRRNQR